MMMTRDEYSERLMEHGFPVLGSGAFSVVHAAGPDKVIKISRDTAWLAWITWAQQDRTRLLYSPKLYGVKWRGDDDSCGRFFTALVERIAMTARYVNVMEAHALQKRFDHDAGLQLYIQNCMKAGFAMNDCHPGNWGLRADGSLVLIDPTTQGPWKLQSRVTGYRLKTTVRI